MPPGYLHECPEGLTIDLVVVPRASRTAVAGELDGRLKLQVAAPPVDGAANKQIVRFLSKKLKVGRSAVSIISGDTGRRKRVLIEGLDAARFCALMGVGG